jgi:hypothetical protein
MKSAIIAAMMPKAAACSNVMDEAPYPARMKHLSNNAEVTVAFPAGWILMGRGSGADREAG